MGKLYLGLSKLDFVRTNKFYNCEFKDTFVKSYARELFDKAQIETKSFYDDCFKRLNDYFVLRNVLRFMNFYYYDYFLFF